MNRTQFWMMAIAITVGLIVKNFTSENESPYTKDSSPLTVNKLHSTKLTETIKIYDFAYYKLIRNGVDKMQKQNRDLHVIKNYVGQSTASYALKRLKYASNSSVKEYIANMRSSLDYFSKHDPMLCVKTLNPQKHSNYKSRYETSNPNNRKMISTMIKIIQSSYVSPASTCARFDPVGFKKKILLNNSRKYPTTYKNFVNAKGKFDKSNAKYVCQYFIKHLLTVLAEGNEGLCYIRNR